MWSGRVVLKYTLFQLPALCIFVLILFFIRRWMDIPTWVIILLAVIWAGKDAVMYPLVWRAYDDRTRDHMKSMIGERGTAMERLSPSGYISVEGESWRAEVGKGSQPVEKGAKVIVKDVKGLTLIVEADQEEL